MTSADSAVKLKIYETVIPDPQKTLNYYMTGDGFDPADWDNLYRALQHVANYVTHLKMNLQPPKPAREADPGDEIE